MHLAVPRFGQWAAILVADGSVLRRVSCGPDKQMQEATSALRSLEPSAAEVVSATLRGAVPDASADARVLRALGADADTAEALAAGGPLILTVVPLTTQAAVDAALVVASRRSPDVAEFAALAVRGAAAISAAFVYEERAALASTLRAALVPAPLPDIPGIDLGATYRPAQETTQIGGDFYDVMARPDRTWALSLGDVCGKGVDAAVLTGQVRQSLRTAGLMSDDPAQTLHLVNDAMLAGGGENFVTLVYGVLDRRGDEVRLRLATGGHPPPLVLSNGAVKQVDARGTIVGMLREVSFSVAEVVLTPGDVLLAFTDGATEARGPRGMLGLEPITRMLADCGGMTAQAITERVMQLVLEHLDGRRHDDIALLAVRCEA